MITARFVAHPGRFKGRVKSVARCEPNRRVVLKRVKRGPNVVVGRDKTNVAGKWKILEPRAEGRYFAKVKKKIFTRNGVEIRCRGDRSAKLRV